MGKLIKVTLLHSAINKQQAQKDTLRGLGLTRLHKTVYLENNSSNRGMIRTVQHLVEVAMVSADDKPAAETKAPSYRIIEAR